MFDILLLMSSLADFQQMLCNLGKYLYKCPKIEFDENRDHAPLMRIFNSNAYLSKNASYLELCGSAKKPKTKKQRQKKTKTKHRCTGNVTLWTQNSHHVL